jgi:hypothetical protein
MIHTNTYPPTLHSLEATNLRNKEEHEGIPLKNPYPQEIC